MKKKLVRVVAVFIAVMMFTAACQGGGSAIPDDLVFDGGEIVTFTFYSEDGVRDLPWNTPIARRMTELTGVALQYDYPVGGLGVRVPLMAASGIYPDLIFAKGDGAILIEAGAVINLAPYIENSKYLKDFYGDLLPRMWHNGDPDTIYSLGPYAINQPIWNVRSSMPVQNAVLKEFGYPEVRTVYELEELLRAYIELYPTTPEGRPVYALTLNNADGWRYIIDLGNPSGFLAGFPDNGEWIVCNETLEATIKYLHPDIKEYYAWLNKLWNDGLLDPDSFTQTNDEYTAKIANGQILATVSPWWQFQEGEQSLRQRGMEDQTFAHLPITFNRDVMPIGSYDPGWSGGHGIMISKGCSDPQRLFDFLDWMTSEEGLVLRSWGVEGLHHTAENGVRAMIPEVELALESDPDYGDSQGFSWLHGFPEIGDGWLDSTGNTLTRNSPESIIRTYSPAARETLAAYDATMWADLFPPTSAFELSPFGAAWQVNIPTDSEINVLMQWVQNTWLPQQMSRVVMVSVEDFDAAWDEAIQILIDGGVYRLNEMFTELVRDKARAWGNY
ncbi:MAG: extracellular solute-binding protein [Defluviitaleaceae bacterium]|nr:extracellular solute-binding protein [Defluviitaleaceae bacterium]MCL2836701.1 extracellular solute-binding protein [Defluviitaleaceae bacterium]